MPEKETCKYIKFHPLWRGGGGVILLFRLNQKRNPENRISFVLESVVAITYSFFLKKLALFNIDFPVVYYNFA